MFLRPSIDRKLVVLVTGLLLATVSAFSWTAYRHIARVELQAAGIRLRSASAPIAQMLSASTQQHAALLARIAASPEVRTFVLTGAGRDAVAAHLSRELPAASRPPGRVQLRDAEGRVLFERVSGGVSAGSGWIERTIRAGEISGGEVRAGPVRATEGRAYVESLTGIPSAESPPARPGERASAPSGRPIGYLGEINDVIGVNADAVRAIIGEEAVILVGTPGEGAWTDLEGETPAPPANLRAGEALVFDSSAWGAGVGAATAVAGTPWVLWVQQPRSVLLAANRDMILDLVLLALAFIGVGAVLAALLARRLATPVVRLTREVEGLLARDSASEDAASADVAAADVASADVASHGQRGDVAAPAVDAGLDEIGRLSDAFARMSDRVHQSHAALAASEQRFRSLIEHASDPVAIVDDGGVVRYASGAFQKVLGFGAAEMLDRHIWSRAHAEDEGGLSGALRELREQPASAVGVRARFQHKDGSWRVLAGTVTNLLAEPAIAGFVFNWRDLTERLSLEAQLRHSQKMEAIGRLAGGIAHDLNNILTAISAFSQFALESLKPGSEVYEDIGQVQLAAQRAASLTRQLLAFSRQQVLQPRPLDLNDVVSQLDGMLRRLIRADVSLSARLGPSLGLVMADPIQVEQVLLNLVLNARDAMPNGGSILIETKNVSLGEEFVRLHPDAVAGPHVELSVIDFGFGMDLETQAQIFEPFYTTKAIGQGTGLGLATVYGIVRQSGGSITVESEVGKGSAFRVYLPAYEGAVDFGTSGSSAQLREVSSATVLVVDDDDGVKRAARRALESVGFTVYDAADGRDALRLAQELERPVDLVITDLVMPDMGGKELAMRLAERLPSVRVLFMSGYTADAMNRPTVLGPDDAFIGKPFSPHELIEKVTITLRHDEKRAPNSSATRRRSAS